MGQIETLERFVFCSHRPQSLAFMHSDSSSKNPPVPCSSHSDESGPNRMQHGDR